jgi:hypothetical protein
MQQRRGALGKERTPSTVGMSAIAGTPAEKGTLAIAETPAKAWKPATTRTPTAGKLVTPWMRGLVRKQEFTCSRETSIRRVTSLSRETNSSKHIATAGLTAAAETEVTDADRSRDARWGTLFLFV